MTISRDERHEREVTKLLQSESRWLQKVLFGLAKAQEARQKLAEERKNAPPPIFDDGAEGLSIEAVRVSLASRVDFLLETIQQRRQVMR